VSTPTLLSKIKRILPGLAWRHSHKQEEVMFFKGIVKSSSWGQTGSLTQTILLDSKLVGAGGYIKLIADTYAYWCPNCKATIWEQELNEHAPMRSGSVSEQKCPYCAGPISPLQPGDKVRAHYRFSPKGNWGSWWAERWDW